jgi:cytochrome c oxidase subunit 3
MAVTLLLILVLAAIAAWWLSQQRLTAKPWLEAGPADAFPATGPSRLPPAALGLGVFLAVAGSLFALFTSAYLMRMHMGDWRPLHAPFLLLWLNTGILIVSDFALERARLAAGRQHREGVRNGLAVAGIAALLFLAGQLLAWRQLAASGQFVATSPASSFFYLLTATHGLHLLGGLVALGRTALKVQAAADVDRVRASVGLCAAYWHFLLVVWIVLFALLWHG